MKRSINSALANVFSIKTKNEATNDFIISSLITQEVTQFRGIELDQLCRRIFSHPKLPTGISFLYKDIDTFCGLPNICFNDSNSELTWLSHLFQFNSDEISTFVSVKKDVEALILMSRHEEAIGKLDFLNAKCGYSFWEIEMRSCIEKYINGKSNQKYITNIRSKLKHKVEDFFLQQILFKHQSKRFETFSKNLVGILDEMRDSSGDTIATHYADVYSSYFLPLEFDKRISIDNRRLWPSTHTSCLDQYLLFKSYFSDKVVHGSGLTSRELSVLRNIVKVINDQEINNLVAVSEKRDINNDQEIDICIERYTNGDYKYVNSKVIDLISTDSRYISLIEVLARSNIYSEYDSENILLEKIVRCFRSVLMSESDSMTKKLVIENIATTFNHSSICSSLLFHLYNTIKNNDHKRDVSRKNCLLQLEYCTPLVINGIRNYHDNFDNAPEYRKLKHRDISNLGESEISEHFHQYSHKCLIKSDYIIDYSDYLIERGDILKCAEFTVDTYIDNNLTFPFLPIKELILLIEDKILEKTTIDIPILYSIYSKNISKDREEEKAEIYEDFINEYETHLPSTLFEDPESITAKIAYFLKNVCVISNMDSSEEFDSTEDIKKERVVILDLLKNTEFFDDLVMSERNSILDELSFDGLKTKFDTSKIFVDVDSIKNEKFERYRFLYELYQDAAVNDQSLNTEDEYTVIDDYKNEKTVVPSSNTTDVLSQIYREIVNDFVCNENYGLDKYLSADIRHGIFVSQIRSGIEKYNIITDIDEDGNYELNSIIDEKYPLLVHKIKSRIHENICVFSKSFDDALNRANSIFNVAIDYNDKNNGLFDFLPMFENISGLRESIKDSSTFEEFFEAIIEYMWKLTLESLENVKRYINEDLKLELTKTINDLETSLINHKRTVPLKEIFEAITHMKASVVEELDRVTSWLNVAEMNESNIYDVKSVVFACNQTFESIFSQYKICLDIDNYTENTTFTYKDAKPLMTSIITALDNANSYGNGKVFLSVKRSGEVTNIIIRNSFICRNGKGLQGLRELISNKMSDNNPSLAKIEGGTGVYKIYNLLKNCPNKFILTCEISDNEMFTLTIGVKDEDFNNRGQ
ncbi:hypothetical protein F0247_22415 [Vibrio crassostreae]|uniref:hypothetical protein n=1 Tax=Vibrio crassostreae TaxID=246167 RepID=UPI00148E4EA6|nr:hypothetical protein [Vibrio crassostreae]NOH77793.1 hypothetical protein [Vibrio crassostreae]